jgi:hypothetical protein
MRRFGKFPMLVLASPSGEVAGARVFKRQHQ